MQTTYHYELTVDAELISDSELEETGRTAFKGRKSQYDVSPEEVSGELVLTEVIRDNNGDVLRENILLSNC